jgi:hypothetical protein
MDDVARLKMELGWPHGKQLADLRPSLELLAASA